MSQCLNKLEVSLNVTHATDTKIPCIVSFPQSRLKLFLVFQSEMIRVLKFFIEIYVILHKKVSMHYLSIASLVQKTQRPLFLKLQGLIKNVWVLPSFSPSCTFGTKDNFQPVTQKTISFWCQSPLQFSSELQEKFRLWAFCIFPDRSIKGPNPHSKVA